MTAETGTIGQVPRRFQEIVRPYLPYASGAELSADDDLAALGLDSMGVVQLLAAVEEGYQLQLPDELLDQESFSTVGTLWQTVAAVLPPEQRGEK
ncbi:phosphopantetheine-binding protein [Micromonospora sp. WMMD1102]|uniref:phosphopantetheine-binding protein n=1 Tax=Micromonospora sp. WMMD1102 TaxID=3016105 RepID=UPI00241541A8|nr:phosphopantetheine-binding protein [Micromonospora sp. WMMD1102]MDG4785091.1 phosphopantetheine-binding protein [Micromonospora sp. WMMD1102]